MGERVHLGAIRALCSARFREYYREPEVLFWSFAFPLLLSAALGLAFRERPVERSRVVVVQSGLEAARVIEALRREPLLEVEVRAAAEAQRALRMGRVELLAVPSGDAAREGVEYRLDPSRPEAAIARARVDDALQRAGGRRDVLQARDVAMTEPGGRYIDFLVPGLIGMNLMGGGMWGVGFSLVEMRIRKLLRRLLATPLRPAEFLAAQMLSRVVFTVAEVAFLLGFGALLFGVPIRGSLAAILVVSLLGAVCFAGLGLLVASRAQKIETVTGLMNVVQMPMFVASGVFFSAERFPESLQPAIRLLPLTALNDALRAVILEGASLPTPAARGLGGPQLRRRPPPLPLGLAVCTRSRVCRRGEVRVVQRAAGDARASAAMTRLRPPSLAA
jgi:ABC-type multidrug transport system permease subunit